MRTIRSGSDGKSDDLQVPILNDGEEDCADLIVGVGTSWRSGSS